MSKNQKLYIVGTGGSARETLTFLEDLYCEETDLNEIISFMDVKSNIETDQLYGYPIIRISSFEPSYGQVIVAIGNSIIRKKVVDDLPNSTCFVKVVHPEAHVSTRAVIGEGTIVAPGAKIMCNVTIGNHSQINLNATISHDCKIGDYFTASPGANVNGTCTIGDHVFIGSNASIKQGITICNNVTVGMGAVVLSDITTPGVYVGVPAKRNID